MKSAIKKRTIDGGVSHLFRNDYRPWRQFFSENIEDDFYKYFNHSLGRGRKNFFKDEKYWCPQVDMIEKDEEFIIKINLPNVEPENIKLEIDENTVAVSGRTSEENETKSDNYHFLERESGDFYRAFSVPAKIDKDRVVAENKNGALKIILPKIESGSKKIVDIKYIS